MHQKKEAFELLDQNGKRIVFYGRTDESTDEIKRYLQAGLYYLKSRGIFKGEIPEREVYIGDMPCKVATSKGYIHSACNSTTPDGRKVILIDKDLSFREKVYQLMHEILHEAKPEYRNPRYEHEVQVETAKCLKELTNQYSLFTHPYNKEHFKELNLNPHLLSQRDLAAAYEQLITQGVYELRREDLKKKSGLERLLNTILIAGFTLPLFFLQEITGNIIKFSDQKTSGGFILLAILFISVITYLYIQWQNQHFKI